MLEWLLNKLFVVHEIGRKGLPRYLTRWEIFGKRFGEGQKVFLHCFHRGDAESYFHDHPWPFWSLILWGGYWEHTWQRKKWYGPLSLLKRPADWAHRVELSPGVKCWTLVWCGKRERSWGFHCPGFGWIGWREHQAKQDSGETGCE